MRDEVEEFSRTERFIPINSGKKLTLQEASQLPITCSLDCCFGPAGDCHCGDCQCCLPSVIITSAKASKETEK